MRYFLIATILLFLTGCSVGMALYGKKDPNLGAIRAGCQRGEVEMQLGRPINSTILENGCRIDVYEYEVGNEPSAGRALAHGVLDVLTFGIWEVVGTPIEGIKGDKREVAITYDENDRVKSMTGSPPKKHF